MKITYILGMLTILVLAGCAQTQVQCWDGSLANTIDECPQQQEEPEPEETEPAPPAPEENVVEEEPEVIDPEVEEIIAQAGEDVDSFSFTYVGPPENKPNDQYFVKGNMVGIELGQATDFKLSQPYTHVYIDTEANTAVAWCAARNVVRCPNGTVEYGEVDVEKHMVRTPYQWLRDIETAELLGNGPQWEKRSTAKVSFETKDGASGEMYIVDYFALPGKVILDNGDTIEFRDLSINSVSDDRVMPPN